MRETRFKKAKNDITIPVNWCDTSLVNVTTKIGSGATPTGGEASYGKTGVSLVRSLNVHNNRFIYDKLAHINEQQASELENVSLEKKDVLINITGASVARCCMIPNVILPARVNQHVSILRTNQEKLDSQYLSLLLSSPEYQKLLLKLSKGNGGTREALTKKMLEEFVITFPEDTTEQTRIATALSDMDSLISTLEALIEKKRAIKQGTMQELLSGKRRLPGFTGEWVKYTLGEVAKINARIGWQGLKSSEFLATGPCFLVTGTDFYNAHINWNSCCFVETNRYEQDKNIQLRQYDVLISKDGTIGKVAYVSHLPGLATLNSGVFVVRSIHKKISQQFLAWIFLSSVFKDFIDFIVSGSTISHLYQRDIVKFAFRCPSEPAEQTAIASILTSMDSEISSLETKLEKYKMVKQGMMQQLLTGKIRLI